jgi:multicomponent Na+:H+ antiporter subunit C
VNTALVVAASLLFGAGTYLLLQRNLTRIIVGLGLVSHAANLLILLSGGRSGAPPITDGSGTTPTDPLPQAMVLTAIVISFGVTVFLLALAYRSHVLTGSDQVEDDVEDRRIARGAES